MKLQKLDDLLVVVFEAHKGVTLLRATDAAKQLVIRVRRRCSHTESISPSLAAEGAMRK